MRVQASWALANLSDALTVSNFKLSSSFYHEILSGASKALNDKDMVKCNAVRALGNILRVIPEQPEDKVLSLSSHISSCISMGTVKVYVSFCTVQSLTLSYYIVEMECMLCLSLHIQQHSNILCPVPCSGRKRC
jgi:hypothetical protein